MLHSRFSIIALISLILLTSSCSRESSTGADSTQKVAAAFSKLKTTYPYRASETLDYLSGGAAPDMHTARLLEMAAADRFHLKVSGFGDIEQVIIGEEIYEFESSHWRKVVKQKPGRSEAEELIAANLKSATDDGVETVNGIPCVRYALTFAGEAAGRPFAGKGKAWVAIADGLPQQSDAELTVSNATNRIHATYEYPLSIVIQKPSF